MDQGTMILSAVLLLAAGFGLVGLFIFTLMDEFGP